MNNHLDEISNALHIRPFAGHLGARVTGVDLSQSLPQETQLSVWSAMLRYKVLFFPDQNLNHAQHARLGRSFGQLIRLPTPHDVMTAEGYPEIDAVGSRDQDEHRLVDHNAGWQTYLSAAVNPPAASILRAERVPSFGGDTHWANLEAALSGLSPAVRDLAEQLRAEHACCDRNGMEVNNGHPLASEHPVVRIHPETGLGSLFVNPVSTRRIIGLNPSQSRALLDLFFEQITRPEFTVRWRWSPGDVVVCDNRSAAYLSFGDASERRLFYRVMMLGDTPVGPDGKTSLPIVGESITAGPDWSVTK
ncbi:TauD/TfdA dioxygenase family protein [Streptomyces sp. NPDC093108]|uniref:TauD/TfdA dioxygenase family protein n=1 Tax=Streptomyces sp. NPDC093108 TaxID=3366030 RepID=UPI00381F96F8